ncbi:TPA: ABC transporter ATP-binding protein [Legionella pneumophila]|nr:ABC transporter transmembrane domain-containing protein [Legionella pneumophila]HAT8868325.1 ABC transporter ATP-binding protein [Legionella pneumophila subsp. pneumophila]HAT7073233.1 ABC transporter ATP-binding protein [Legionella pneumophila]HAT8642241.1 ABC transporter ATP-binding protein [Legionella pneumophila]HAT8890576.1 ABC transporter ATP-binding protein [Legionella pneumophila subsp. pneumophila]HAT8933174.1 ABC transporter ATP-binding protein [Legionella pneumophila subsp. pneum
MNEKPINSIIDVLDRQTLSSIAMISVLVSLLSLSIPIAAQTLVNLIAFGKLLQPLITLSFMVLILMVALGALQIWQSVIIEVIQQKLMVKVSLSLTRHFTHMSLDNFSTHHGPELVNRFFEIVTIKKSLASLLLYGINLGLQLFFGLLLILIYHPLFLLFDIFIILSILLIIFIPYKKALVSAKKECSEKHVVGAWLEEILINRYLFRFSLYHRFVTQQTDKKLVAFLKARNTHFKQLIKHQIGFYTLSALASSLLLGLGGYLVINDQLSLGQLVAAEIVLGALIYSFKRFSVLLENYYELVASENKIDAVLNLSLEQVKEEDSGELLTPIKSIQLGLDGKDKALITADNPLLVSSEKPDICQLFVEQLLGFQDPVSLQVLINGIPCMKKNLISLRRFSLLIAEPQWFTGSIYDNLVLNHRTMSNKVIIEQLKNFGLADKIIQLPEGLHTILYEWRDVFTSVEIIKLMLVRAMLLQPELIVIDRAFDILNRQEINEMMALVLTLKNTLLVIVSQHADFNKLTNRLVVPS